MGTILDLTSTEVRNFLLKSECYINFDLPHYFNFEIILSKVAKKLNDSKNLSITDIIDTTTKPNTLDDINYRIMGNKDGKYDWRPLEFIHPVLYVWLAQVISQEDNWRVIKDRFMYFSKNNLVECKSLPVKSSHLSKSDKSEQVLQWWLEIEQRSIELGLEYDILFQTDIANCYSTIYTHSIAWAIHTKHIAKQNKTDKTLLGNIIDRIICDMTNGQTNGIPQGSVIMDLIAELVLGYADEILTNKIHGTRIDQTDFKIIRYRDDYRIFSNNYEIIDKIAKLLSESLMDLGLRLNSNKTGMSKNVLTKSLKADKIHWIQYEQRFDDPYKELQLIHLFSEKYPNSGTLISLLSNYHKKIILLDRISSNITVMISYIVDIAYTNPRTYSMAMAIISKLLTFIRTDESKIEIINLILQKFSKIPNTGIMQIWLQRAIINTGYPIDFSEDLCKLVSNVPTKLWNSAWLKPSYRSIINSEDIINRDNLITSSEIIDSDEVELFTY